MPNLLSQITIEVDGEESSCEELGLTAPQVQRRNGQGRTFTVKHAGCGFDSEPIFSYGDEIIVRIGRERPNANAPWTGGTIVFVGKLINPTGSMESKVDDYDFFFADAYFDLTRITYGQKWRTKFQGGAAYEETSEVNCPTRVNSVTNTLTHITNGEQIRDAVQWAIDQGVNLQIGTITPAMYLPVDHFVDQKCSMIIDAMLKVNPTAVCVIDPTTTNEAGAVVPTFHCVERSAMEDVVFHLSDEKIASLKITRRDDLVVPAVVIKYKRTDVIDGITVNRSPYIDRAPVDATGFEDNALMQCVQLFGARTRKVIAIVDGEDAPTLAQLATATWWEQHGQVIGNYASISITPDPLPTDLPYLLTNGSIARWIKAENGDAAEVEPVEYTATCTLTDTNGSVLKNKKLKVRLRATNIAPGEYTDRVIEEAAEFAVSGLAQQMLNALSVVHHDGQLTVTEEECSEDLDLINTLSIAGGTGRYATMKAMVQGINMDLVTGTRNITFGWPKHLSIDDIIEIGRLNRTRWVETSPEVQVTGDYEGEGSMTLPEHHARENAAAGESLYEVHVVKGTNKVTANGVAGSLDIRSANPATVGNITMLLSEALGQDVRLRKLPFAKRNADGSCTTVYRVVLCGDETTS